MLPEETATAADAAPGLEGVAAATESGFTEEGGEEEEGVSSSELQTRALLPCGWLSELWFLFGYPK